MAARKSNSPALIPAVAYLRKSTAGIKADGRQRQENSIGNQRVEIEQLAKKHGYEIVRWYSDEGKSGWKMGAKRPGFQQLIADAERLQDIKAVVVDDLDRFSRAKVMQTFGVYSRLAESGVKLIHSANDGKFPLDDKDIGTTITLVVKTHGANAYAYKLANRIAETRRNRALDGKRSGGKAPYGLANDGKGGLKAGDPAHAKIVRWIFDQYTAVKPRSLWSIANELNNRGVKSSRGKKWRTQVVKDLLKNEAYRGDFAYNKRKSGDFFYLDENAEIKDVSENEDPSRRWRATPEGVIRSEGAYAPMVPPAIYDKAQKRLPGIAGMKRSPRGDQAKYPLTGILKCGHCGGPMPGRTVVRKYRNTAGEVKSYEPFVEYRCSAYELRGKDACGYHVISQNVILPFLMEVLGGEIDRLKMGMAQFGAHAIAKPGGGMLLSLPPLDPPKEKTDPLLDAMKHQAADLNAKIELGCENMLLCSDPSLRARCISQVSALQKEYEILLSQIKVAEKAGPSTDAYSREDFDEIQTAILSVPVARGQAICDARAVHSLLLDLGAEVQLWWDSAEKCLKNGKKCKFHTLRRGRFRVGVQAGNFSGHVKPAPAGRGDMGQLS